MTDIVLLLVTTMIYTLLLGSVDILFIPLRITLKQPQCHDLAKQLSQYLYFFSLDLLYKGECRKVSHDQDHSHSHKTH